MYYLGMTLIFSDFIDRSINEGLGWLEKAAEGGRAEAAINLGHILTSGSERLRDYRRGAAFLSRRQRPG